MSKDHKKLWTYIRRGSIVALLALLVWAFAWALGVVGPGPLHVQEGDTMPSFALPQPGHDAPVTLEQFAGRGLLVNFTATTCKPCQEELRVLQQLYARYHGQHFAMVSISHERPKILQSFSDYHKISWPVLHDKRAVVRGRMGIEALPASVFVSPDGRVAGVLRSAMTLQESTDAVERLIILSRQSKPD